MITENESNWHYLAIKNLPRLYSGLSSNHHGDFICRNFGHAYRTDNALKEHENLCYDHDHCDVKMPEPGKNILKYNSGEKTIKIPHAIYFDLETLQIPNETNQFTDLRECYTKQVTIHVALVRSYDKNIVKTYKGKDCIQRFCDDLYELGMKAVNAPKKRIMN